MLTNFVVVVQCHVLSLVGVLRLRGHWTIQTEKLHAMCDLSQTIERFRKCMDKHTDTDTSTRVHVTRIRDYRTLHTRS